MPHQLGSCQRHALCVVACAAGDDAPLQRLLGQLGHLVERATQLERKHLQETVSKTARQLASVLLLMF
jgi:hypothetical protein